jgi:hypothetical protein
MRIILITVAPKFANTLRKLRMVLLFSLLPLIALSLYLYWLTLPGYVPTGNEVYDAFAPMAYKYQQFDNAIEMIDKPLYKYLSRLKTSDRRSKFLGEYRAEYTISVIQKL